MPSHLLPAVRAAFSTKPTDAMADPSVRGFLSIDAKKYRLKIQSSKTAAGERAYQSTILPSRRS